MLEEWEKKRKVEKNVFSTMFFWWILAEIWQNLLPDYKVIQAKAV